MEFEILKQSVGFMDLYFFNTLNKSGLSYEERAELKCFFNKCKDAEKEIEEKFGEKLKIYSDDREIRRLVFGEKVITMNQVEAFASRFRDWINYSPYDAIKSKYGEKVTRLYKSIETVKSEMNRN